MKGVNSMKLWKKPTCITLLYKQLSLQIKAAAGSGVCSNMNFR